MRSFTAVRRVLVFVPVLMVINACTAASGYLGHYAADGDRNLITREEILESGAQDAWEALRKAGTHLVIRENAQGRIAATHRGRNSLILSTETLLVVDESMSFDFGILRSIPASNVAYIQILSAAEGTVRYGTAAGNGVVVVRTDAFNEANESRSH